MKRGSNAAMACVGTVYNLLNKSIQNNLIWKIVIIIIIISHFIS